MTRTILPEPPEELKRHSDRLAGLIHSEIQATGPMPFSRYMEMALYEPGLGYYSAGLHKLGETGDFITSPEIGPLFAACLARQAAQTAQELGDYEILEVGAGTGKLAVDLLAHADPRLAPRRYRILERSADLRQVQRRRFEREAPGWLGRVEWLDSPPDRSWQGLLIANEVIDALAAERFQIETGGEVSQMCVDQDGNTLGWANREAPPELENAVRHLEESIGGTLPAGFRSELRLHLPEWLDSLTANMKRGLALFVDYGHARSDFYHADRREGTLMCHYRHRAHDDPFFWPGLQDLTAWVDFTALAEAADHCGLDVEGYASQAMFLLGCGLEAVLQDLAAASGDHGVALAAEARQLTLPGMMGERFKVMGLGRGLEILPRGFELEDIRYRL
ncbi:MAG: SAM-dependent methyltransferase [Lysobacterales bacterium]|jgi:SAM-dependent MidA family methyltransferase